MHDFHAHKHQDTQASETADSVIHWASQYDLLLKLLFLGQEQAVRRRLLEPAAIQSGHRVLDVGCGPGTMALVTVHVDPASASGEQNHNVDEHEHDDLPRHSH